MRMTIDDFDARAFFELGEVVGWVRHIPPRRVRRWLRSAGVATRNAAGAPVVTRAALESAFPEILEAGRRMMLQQATRDHESPQGPRPSSPE